MQLLSQLRKTYGDGSEQYYQIVSVITITCVKLGNFIYKIPFVKNDLNLNLVVGHYEVFEAKRMVPCRLAILARHHGRFRKSLRAKLSSATRLRLRPKSCSILVISEMPLLAASWPTQKWLQPNSGYRPL